jgi:hypothetical protein
MSKIITLDELNDIFLNCNDRKELLEAYNKLPEASKYQDTEADGVVFCGKCGNKV